jgi:hypothetical protein
MESTLCCSSSYRHTTRATNTKERRSSSRRYCPTKENLADDGSRGLTPEQLGPESRWQNGPEVLRKRLATY